MINELSTLPSSCWDILGDDPPIIHREGKAIKSYDVNLSEYEVVLLKVKARDLENKRKFKRNSLLAGSWKVPSPEKERTVEESKPHATKVVQKSWLSIQGHLNSVTTAKAPIINANEKYSSWLSLASQTWNIKSPTARVEDSIQSQNPTSTDEVSINDFAIPTDVIHPVVESETQIRCRLNKLVYEERTLQHRLVQSEKRSRELCGDQKWISLYENASVVQRAMQTACAKKSHNRNKMIRQRQRAAIAKNDKKKMPIEKNRLVLTVYDQQDESCRIIQKSGRMMLANSSLRLKLFERSNVTFVSKTLSAITIQQFLRYLLSVRRVNSRARGQHIVAYNVCYSAASTIKKSWLRHKDQQRIPQKCYKCALRRERALALCTGSNLRILRTFLAKWDRLRIHKKLLCHVKILEIKNNLLIQRKFYEKLSTHWRKQLDIHSAISLRQKSNRILIRNYYSQLSRFVLTQVVLRLKLQERRSELLTRALNLQHKNTIVTLRDFYSRLAASRRLTISSSLCCKNTLITLRIFYTKLQRIVVVKKLVGKSHLNVIIVYYMKFITFIKRRERVTELQVRNSILLLSRYFKIFKCIALICKSHSTILRTHFPYLMLLVKRKERKVAVLLTNNIFLISSRYFKIWKSVSLYNKHQAKVFSTANLCEKNKKKIMDRYYLRLRNYVLTLKLVNCNLNIIIKRFWINFVKYPKYVFRERISLTLLNRTEKAFLRNYFKTLKSIYLRKRSDKALCQYRWIFWQKFLIMKPVEEVVVVEVDNAKLSRDLPKNIELDLVTKQADSCPLPHEDTIVNTLEETDAEDVILPTLSMKYVPDQLLSGVAEGITRWPNPIETTLQPSNLSLAKNEDLRELTRWPNTLEECWELKNALSTDFSSPSEDRPIPDDSLVQERVAQYLQRIGRGSFIRFSIINTITGLQRIGRGRIQRSQFGKKYQQLLKSELLFEQTSLQKLALCWQLLMKYRAVRKLIYDLRRKIVIEIGSLPKNYHEVCSSCSISLSLLSLSHTLRFLRPCYVM